MQIEWAFKGVALAGRDRLLDCFPETAFDSPTRSTIALLEHWRSTEQRVRELARALGLPVPRRVQLDFEHMVHPPKGRGKPSCTDLMVISPDFVVAIEAKWTEPRYPVVEDWLDGTENRKQVLQGWCDLLELRAESRVATGDLHGLPYQMVHRAASACHQRKAASCRVAYLVFETTARARSECLEDLALLRDVLGSRSSLGMALAECSIEQSRTLNELRRQWESGERHLHAPVLRGLKGDGLLRTRLERVHCL
ncbi:MAG: hypothetical protein OXH79_10735 [Boseongicola sp.]|nr:hypothetical protein [Boseongicola sp.]